MNVLNVNTKWHSDNKLLGIQWTYYLRHVRSIMRWIFKTCIQVCSTISETISLLIVVKPAIVRSKSYPTHRVGYTVITVNSNVNLFFKS